MTDLPPDMQVRREVEDRALKLGAERAELENRLGTNTEQISDLLSKALDAGVPIDHYARMVGVSRQTLHRWRGVIARLRANAQES
jgi:hypothetical protein